MSLSIESPLSDLTFKKNTLAVVWIGEEKKSYWWKAGRKAFSSLVRIKIMIM